MFGHMTVDVTIFQIRHHCYYWLRAKNRRTFSSKLCKNVFTESRQASHGHRCGQAVSFYAKAGGIRA